jgi:hypothetical protein
MCGLPISPQHEVSFGNIMYIARVTVWWKEALRIRQIIYNHVNEKRTATTDGFIVMAGTSCGTLHWKVVRRFGIDRNLFLEQSGFSQWRMIKITSVLSQPEFKAQLKLCCLPAWQQIFLLALYLERVYQQSSTHLEIP